MHTDNVQQEAATDHGLHTATLHGAPHLAVKLLVLAATLLVLYLLHVVSAR